MLNARAHHPSPMCLALSCLLAMWLAIAGSARADTITVPLPGLLAEYVADDVAEHSTSVTLAVDPMDIVSVSMHVRGTVLVGINECVPWGGIDWVQYPLRPNLRLHVNDPIHDGSLWASAKVPDAEVAQMNVVSSFEVITGFRAFFDATWDFVASSPVVLVMSAVPNGSFSDCNWLLAPRTTVEVAELIIETQHIVAASETAWGAVKALYREGR